jgi:hypothetical protein
MYVKEMTMAEAKVAKEAIEHELANVHCAARRQQLEWDLEDVDGRISELTDWY